MNSKTITSIFWKILERGGFHGAKLLIQIVLARILAPENFGTLTILLVFVDIFSIFVQSGLNTALIQNKETSEEDFSSILWVSVGISAALYAVLYLIAPAVAHFYNDLNITVYLRTIGCVLIGGAVNSIQIAYASRTFNFRSQFLSNSAAVILSGIVGIAMALNGAGVWSLIVQQIMWQGLNCLILGFLIKWRPKFVINGSRVKVLMGFGWKMLASSLLIRMNSMLANLIVGKRYSAESLAFYTKAQNFPTAFSDVVVSSISSVALVSVSSIQEDKARVKNSVRLYVSNSMFFVAPLMIGLACAAQPFIRLLLTDSWLPCVPYLQVFCVLYLFQPLCAIFGQAISGYGRSDLYLRAFLVAKPAGLALMFLVVWLSDDPLYMAVSVVVTSVFEMLVQSSSINKLLGYSLREQIKDWLQPVAAALIMAVPVYAMNLLSLPPLVLLIAQIAAGAVIYAAASWLLGCPQARTIVSKLWHKLSRK